jgi:hypothetical protein
VNGLQLKYMLNGQRVGAPEPLLRHYPELRQIADAVIDEGVTLPLLREHTG